jgi:RNA polymerase sigma factor (sigma-70 family)
MAQETSAEILARYRGGDDQAADELFSRFVGRLTLLARSRLSPKLASRTDPEDVILSAYRSFFIGAREGRFLLTRSGDLWRLLVSITMHKLYRQVRKHSAEMRSASAEQSLSSTKEEELPLAREPSPDEAVTIADELEAFMSTLDAFARRVFELRLQEEQISTISAETGRSERTVRRMLRTIRERLADRLERRING